MKYNEWLADLGAGDQIEGFYILRTAQRRVSSNGKPYLSGSLSDCSGTIEIKCWDYAGPIDTVDEGKVLKIRGTVSEFRGALQLTLERLRIVEEDDVFDRTRLVPVAPIDLEAAYAELEEITESIEDADYRAVCCAMLARRGDALRSLPAGKSVHHDFIGGLLMHTCDMLRTADFLAALYADTIDRSLLLAGTLLHDLAKAEEFTLSPLGLVSEYSVEGQLLGHLVMGARDVAQVAQECAIPQEKSVLLQHLILSHHGQPAFGAAVLPQCAESELLYLIDTIDSRMEIYRAAMDETPVGAFSKKIFALDRRIYHHP